MILVIGEAVGIGPAIAAADRLRSSSSPSIPLVLLGSAEPFPFRPRPSAIVVAGVPPDCIACMPLLEEWDIASRLASPAGLPGCFEGTVVELADLWLASLGPSELASVEILASGPASMLEAVAALAARYAVPLSRN